MNMDRKTILGILSIALAVLVPVGMALQAHNGLQSNPVVKIKITGYDPRDLLHGHYLLFNYDWNWADRDDAQMTCTGEHCCLCVEAKEIDPEVRLMECPAARTDASCAHTIRGASWSGADFNGPPTEYYVDETKALPLERFFREQQGKTDFHMGLSLPPSGKARIERLYIDGKPYLNYMAEHPEKFVLQNETPAGPLVTEPPAQQ